jgi:anti-anti-sigma factor
MSRSDFTVHQLDTLDGPTTAITVAGEIDVTNAGDFAESIAALGETQPIILDLSRLSYLDSAGFAALDRLLADGSVLIVVSPQSRIYKAAVVIELPFHPDIDAACRTLNSRG